MTPKVVVLGAGYAGAAAVPHLEAELDDAELVWVSEHDYHLVLHESHRVIRDPSVRSKITVPVAAIKSPETRFVEGRVSDVDTEARTVALEDGRTERYDYLVVALGSGTAYYGIPGLAHNAHTLKSLDDALAIHEAVREAARGATADDPARVVVGGAGLSGVQSAGEIAEYRDHHGAPIDVCLVEALDEILPGQDATLQAVVRRKLEARDVRILTDDPIVEAESTVIHFDQRSPLDYDVLVWTGGVTGREALAGASVEKEHNRVEAAATFETSDERVFAVGDAALVEQDGDVAPPTAQAAWSAGEAVAKNVAARIRGDPLDAWRYHDKGTLVSVGEVAIAHDVDFAPVKTFDALPARLLKKATAARWIADVASWRRALTAWDAL